MTGCATSSWSPTGAASGRTTSPPRLSSTPASVGTRAGGPRPFFFIAVTTAILPLGRSGSRYRSERPPTRWPATPSPNPLPQVDPLHASDAEVHAVPSGAICTLMNSPSVWHRIGPHSPPTNGSAGSFTLSELKTGSASSALVVSVTYSFHVAFVQSRSPCGVLPSHGALVLPMYAMASLPAEPSASDGSTDSRRPGMPISSGGPQVNPPSRETAR